MLEKYFNCQEKLLIFKKYGKKPIKLSIFWENYLNFTQFAVKTVTFQKIGEKPFNFRVF